jgi:cyanophycin synthetase
MADDTQRSDSEVELLELRVLDGPNRFFSRPAVKIEFIAPTPGTAAEVAAGAGLAVRRLYVALGLAAPRIVSRRSTDDTRALIAYPWRRRTIAQAIAAAASRLALRRSTDRQELPALRAMALGPLPHLPRPRVPLVAITGTNGKSTTTRLVAHIATEAGMRVGMTNSDGIYVAGELVEAGDWTGFGGAARILAEPDLELAVLETARGGILLRGIGYSANDVGVVTNVSADHLGLQGIDTLDELAETKAAVVRMTKPGGWAVLNGDDPRTWAMRRETRAGWYPFSLDPASVQGEEALDAGGRAAVLERGWLVLRAAGRRPVRLAREAELPLALHGLARYNVANALAAAAACDALELPHKAIAAGLRSFAQDTAANPGRLNLFEREGTVVLIDFAHNEAGLEGLAEVSRGLAGTHRVRMAIGTAGDRTDEVLRNLGTIGGRAADELVICEKVHYLRGRDREELNGLLRKGAAKAGYRGKVPAYPSELAALQALLTHADEGDVVAIMSHVERLEIFEWLRSHGFEPIPPERLRDLVGGTAESTEHLS